MVAIHEEKKMTSKLDTRGKTCLLVMQMTIQVMCTDHQYTNQECYFEQRCTMAEFILETLQNET